MKTDREIQMPGKALVVGMGVSGRALCELLLRGGVRVTATDMRPRGDFGDALDPLEACGCSLKLGAHDLRDFLDADLIIVSPGVPLDIEPLRQASLHGVKIVGELDWASRFVDRPIVAVTGTNGKTTTTSLIGEMCKAAGRRAFVGGNIGTPLSKWVLDGEDAEVLVLEVSSFQLDTADTFRPDVGVLLNITEDHLDRYENFQAYADSKMSLFARQTGNQIAIVNGDDPLALSRCSEIGSRLLIGSRRLEKADALLRNGRVRVNIPWKAPFEIGLENSPLKGAHNEENLVAAILAAAAIDLPPDAISRAIGTYRGLPHRVEWVRTWRGVDFYDDSKATNVGAVAKALEGFERPVLILMGGRDKLGSYGPLKEGLKAKGKGIFVFGEAAPRIREELEEVLPASSFPDLEAAFHEAVKRAEPGDVVLLSPACSSFDQYASYGQRGDHFKKLVAQLAN
ncbi:MAG: UDP-N-acetylmuramoyl-L-alanine--D-glutamate ligase [Syntrophobacteraceae bacterium]|nr:UDP-N-acetylmuramoyl-L-alanine--D-glutamate ligase [Desulfobacteraceae bacterium]